MASIIGVETLQHPSGNTAATIDSSGIVTMANTVMYDTFRLNANVTANGTMTAWERPDDAMAATVGDQMSVSSGIFTFPRTGIYRVFYFGQVTNETNDSFTSVALHGTTNNSTYDILAFAGGGENGNAGTENYGCFAAEAVVNISDTSNRKVKLEAGSISSGSFIISDTGFNRTYISFQYLAPST